MARGSVTLRLTVDVTYKLNNTRISELKDMLSAIPVHAAGNGMFTGETSAEVDNWMFKVYRQEKKYAGNA